MTAVNSELGADFEQPFQPAHRSAPANSIFDPPYSNFRTAHMLWRLCQYTAVLNFLLGDVKS